MERTITFPGGKRVDASFGDHVLRTDQPVAAGGEGSAPAPFDLFLASLGTCAGLYVLGFCQARGISTDGLELVERVQTDATTHLPTAIDIDVRVPSGFPEKYLTAVQHAAEHCKVKHVLASPPSVRVAVVREGIAAAGVG